MKITSVTVSKGMKISHKFCSVDTTISMSADIDDTESEEDVISELSTSLDTMVGENIDSSLRELNNKLEGH